jgi:hypothetical protein
MKIHEDVIGAIGGEAVPLRGPESVAGLADRLKGKRVVMLGEATCRRPGR